jgi:hypothetical protein
MERGHADQRYAKSVCQSFGFGEPDAEPGVAAGSYRHGYGVDFAFLFACGVKALLDVAAD